MNTIKKNDKLKGLSRDKHILRTVDEYRALSREQIQALLFSDHRSFRTFENAKRKSQERVLVLHRDGKLNRSRIKDDSYIYYIDQKPGMLQHLVSTNWFRIWLPQTLHSWDRLHSWQYEQDYKVLRADGFAAIKNGMSGEFRFMFLEMDRGTNQFDKVQKYNQLYDSEKYAQAWWVKLTERFPVIQVVTVTESRKNLIQAKIEAENEYGLEFRVHLLDDLRGEVMSKCLGMNTTGRID